MELGRVLHGLSEHVRDVVRGANEGDLEFEGLDIVRVIWILQEVSATFESALGL